MACTHVRVALCLLWAALSCAFKTPSVAMGRNNVISDTHQRTGGIYMGRKGRPQIPKGMGGGQQQPNPLQGTDSRFPTFYIYARSANRANMWYPVSILQGDEQSKSVVDGYVGGSFGQNIFRNRIDGGIAKSVFGRERQLADTVIKMYPQLKKSKMNLEYGYKIASKELTEAVEKGDMEPEKIRKLSPDMGDGVVEQAQNALGGVQNAIGNLFKGGD